MHNYFLSCNFHNILGRHGLFRNECERSIQFPINSDFSRRIPKLNCLLFARSGLFSGNNRRLPKIPTDFSGQKIWQNLVIIQHYLFESITIKHVVPRQEIFDHEIHHHTITFLNLRRCVKRPKKGNFNSSACSRLLISGVDRKKGRHRNRLPFQKTPGIKSNKDIQPQDDASLPRRGDQCLKSRMPFQLGTAVRKAVW